MLLCLRAGSTWKVRILWSYKISISVGSTPKRRLAALIKRFSRCHKHTANAVCLSQLINGIQTTCSFFITTSAFLSLSISANNSRHRTRLYYESTWMSECRWKNYRFVTWIKVCCLTLKEESYVVMS
jgi:hypothetical protein